MTTLTALEIATNHPNGDILIEAVQHKETGKWTSLMYLLRDGNIHKLMLSFDINENFQGFETELEAKTKMDELCQVAIDHCKEKGFI